MISIQKKQIIMEIGSIKIIEILFLKIVPNETNHER